MARCAYDGCENIAEYRCAVCGEMFCEFHIYQRGGYICKDDYDMRGLDPFAPGQRGLNAEREPPALIRFLNMIFGKAK